MSLLSTQAPSREYANRPADERYPSVQAMIDAAEQERKRSAERTFNVKDLRAVAVDGPAPTGDVPQLGEVRLQNPQGNVAKFTNWAFGQFSRMVGAPASYLRDIPAALAAQCLNYGISQTQGDAVLLVKAPNGDPSPIVRACTSDSYARVWDSHLYAAVQQQIIAHDPRWTLPPTWTGEAAGAYRGDRDSFLVLVNGGSIVTDPTLRAGSIGTGGNGTTNLGKGPDTGMYRGLLIRNSEVGASSITIESILYRYICGNHLLWGAVMDRSFRRRHVGTKVVRDAIREISQFAYNYVNRSAERDNAIISQLVTSQLAQTKEAVIDELRKLGATKEQAESAYTVCEEKETASPRSYWGLAQGMTRLSQESAWQDGRFELDQLAAKILSRGAKLVRA